MTTQVFNHVGIHITDLERARRFYDAVLEQIGVRRFADFPEVRASAYGVPAGSFRIVQPAHAISASSSHIALNAGSCAQVEAFHSEAMRRGATSVESPHYYDDVLAGERYRAYTASFRDADGHHIEAVFVERIPSDDQSRESEHSAHE